jgi:DNA-directed RNA polymerase subunit RPC12/RpoP
MDISKWNNADSLTYCNKCNADNIIRLVWVLEGVEPIIHNDTGITRCQDCNSKEHLKQKPFHLWEQQTKVLTF